MTLHADDRLRRVQIIVVAVAITLRSVQSASTVALGRATRYVPPNAQSSRAMSNASMRNAFLLDGFLHIPQALDAETVEAVSACWSWSIAHPGPAAARLYRDSLVRVDGQAAARLLPGEENGFFYQDIGNAASRPVYERLLGNPAIVGLLADLLEGERAWFLGEQVFLKEGNTPATGWHQDISDIPARGDDLVVFWITLDAVDEETGLGLVRGSHRGPVYSSIYGQFEADAIPDVDERPDEFEVVSHACEPGDVVVFHMGCLHGRGHTRPGQRRRSLALRFIGERCFFESRTNPGDPRNGEPFRREGLRQVLPSG